MTKTTKKMTTISILTALAFILMLIEIPFFIVPGLNFDLSDIVVLVVLMVYGWKEAAFIGIVKALLHAWLKPAFGPVYIGEITAVLASMTYIIGFYIAANKFKWNKYFTALFTIGVVTLLLTALNYFFITPTYLMGGFSSFVPVKDINVASIFGLDWDLNYFTSILAIYIPFNLLKGLSLFVIFVPIQDTLKTAFDNMLGE